MTIQAFPLAWPVGWKRTPSNKIGRSRYRTSMAAATRHLLNELRKFGATHVVVSSNVQLRRDGLPYASAPSPRDCGVAVYWNRRGQAMVMACDQWSTVAENAHAIGLSIAALRSIERAGASTILERAFTGFVALPAGESWRDVLGFARDERVSIDHIRIRMRELAYTNHPDRGGSTEAMARINDAASAAMRELGNG